MNDDIHYLLKGLTSTQIVFVKHCATRANCDDQCVFFTIATCREPKYSTHTVSALLSALWQAEAERDEARAKLDALKNANCEDCKTIEEGFYCDTIKERDEARAQAECLAGVMATHKVCPDGITRVCPKYKNWADCKQCVLDFAAAQKGGAE